MNHVPLGRGGGRGGPLLGSLTHTLRVVGHLQTPGRRGLLPGHPSLLPQTSKRVREIVYKRLTQLSVGISILQANYLSHSAGQLSITAPEHLG